MFDSADRAGAGLQIGIDAALTIELRLRTRRTNAVAGAAHGWCGSTAFTIENARLATRGEFGEVFEAMVDCVASCYTGRSHCASDGLKPIDGTAHFGVPLRANQPSQSV